MKVTIKDVGIKAITVVVPKQKRGYDDLAKIIGEKDARRICQNTGIDFVRVSKEGETAADLCEVAAKIIIEGTSSEGIVGVVFVSQTPDYIMPATSCILQHKLGLPSETVCYDVNSGCTGFVKGLHLASMIASSTHGDVLLMVGDTMTKHVSLKDHSLYLVMGDAGSAALVSYMPGKNITFNMQTFGEGYESLIIPAGGNRIKRSEGSGIFIERENGNWRSQEHLYMDGMGIMAFALSKAANQIKQDLSLMPFEPDTYLLHQANKFIVSNLARNLKLDLEKVPIVISDYGNTGQCTIPLVICDRFINKEGSLQKSYMAAFGVGLTVATASMDLSEMKIYPVKEI